MRQASLVDDVTQALHMDATVRSRVGGRVHSAQKPAELPDIVITEISSGDDRNVPARKIVLTCRAKTSLEARRIGAAVKTALSGQPPATDGHRWVATQDRSGYDSSARLFRRVISLEPSSDQILER
jgi:hypothetical protein